MFTNGVTVVKGYLASLDYFRHNITLDVFDLNPITPSTRKCVSIDLGHLEATLEKIKNKTKNQAGEIRIMG